MAPAAAPTPTATRMNAPHPARELLVRRGELKTDMKQLLEHRANRTVPVFISSAVAGLKVMEAELDALSLPMKVANMRELRQSAEEAALDIWINTKINLIIDADLDIFDMMTQRDGRWTWNDSTSPPLASDDAGNESDGDLSDLDRIFKDVERAGGYRQLGATH